ncbi:hypothetical protein SLS60_007478 [Paraconiothyrium brasiliense]|uniref:DUF7708 domain-containing protein n=1 Tax=Paraconiothyrium brasiliense TaxID=300254 RepID=A0ABR3R5H0_9PLEO
MSLLPWKGNGRTAGKAESAHLDVAQPLKKSTQGSLRDKLRGHLRIPSRDPSKRDGSRTPSPVTPTAEKDLDAKSAVSQGTTIQPDQDLWEKAFRAIDDEDAQKLKLNGAERNTILKSLMIDVEAKRRNCLEKRWRYTKSNGDSIVLRDVFEKVATWVEKFKQIGDVVAQYDATQMSLPWAGIRLLLQVTVNDVQTFGAMAEGVEYISNLVTRCAIIEELYLQGASEPKAQLEQAIVKLYAAILEYVLKARRYYDKSTAGSTELSRVALMFADISLGRLTTGLVQTPEMIVEGRIHAISKAHTEVNDCMRLVEAEGRLPLG